MKQLTRYIPVVLLAFAVTMVSCKKDDATGASGLSPTSPSVVLDVPTVEASFDYGDGGSYEIEITLNEPQIVDVKVFVSQSGGDAVEDEDYTLSAHSVVIPAYRTTSGKKITLTIMDDAVRSEDRMLELAIGDDRTSNASLTPSSITTTLKKAPDCILFPDASALVGDYDEYNDDGSVPTTSDVSIDINSTPGGFTITNFAFSDDWWCGHTGATLDLILNTCDNTVWFPDGGAGASQAVGGMDDLCGYSGPVVYLNDLGTYDPATGVINFNIEVTVDAGSFGNTDLTYTPK